MEMHARALRRKCKQRPAKPVVAVTVLRRLRGWRSAQQVIAGRAAPATAGRLLDGPGTVVPSGGEARSSGGNGAQGLVPLCFDHAVPDQAGALLQRGKVALEEFVGRDPVGLYADSDCGDHRL